MADTDPNQGDELVFDKNNLYPDGHPKSPTCGHLKIPHPQHLPEI